MRFRKSLTGSRNCVLSLTNPTQQVKNTKKQYGCLAIDLLQTEDKRQILGGPPHDQERLQSTEHICKRIQQTDIEKKKIPEKRLFLHLTYFKDQDIQAVLVVHKRMENIMMQTNSKVDFSKRDYRNGNASPSPQWCKESPNKLHRWPLHQADHVVHKRMENMARQISSKDDFLNDQEIEKKKSTETNSPTHNSQRNINLKEKPSFAAVAKGTMTKSTNKTKSRQQHLAVIKPVDEQSSSISTRNFVRNIDITKVKIGMKKVSNIKNGEILIKAAEQTDLGKLLSFDANNEIKQNYKIRKPIKENPNLFAMGVSEDTSEETVVNCIKLQCSLKEEDSNVLKMVHS
ncbi:hypothetical protein CEXT_782271 [Caerostris extrusa]|uniref:Uncharacterized protein n=1 Tax=Caerostris extrusa TaxID=172846 RepID=A0AAV4SR45_CAEEX|nr:hypothetical protein CEXT_782271 [Caerostris extrusa]